MAIADVVGRGLGFSPATDGFMITLGFGPFAAGWSSVYGRALLATQQIIPLFHLPVAYAASSALKNWTVQPDGSLSLADARLENGRP